MIAATSSSSAAIAGVVMGQNTYTVAQFEVDVGLGAAGVETSIGIIRMDGPNSGNGPGSIFMLRTVISGISAGARVSIRLRAVAASFPFGDVGMGLLYYESFDSSLKLTDTLTAGPLAANSAAVTPNASAWANSAWVTLNSGEALASLVMGIAMDNVVANTDTEWDLGVGSPSPSVVTTFRSATCGNNIGRLWYVMLPALLPVDPAAVVSVRMRKTGTSTLANHVALLYFLGATPPPPPPNPVSYPTRRLRRFALPFNQNKWTRISRFELILQAGVGLSGTAATVQGYDPLVMFRLSRDGGQTWDTELTMSMGKIGEYERRAFLNMLGRARNPVVEITSSDPVFISWIEATADLDEGTS
jgi:hypothetical protein